MEYFVRWKYYNDTTWEPEENLQNVLQMIEEFEKKVNLVVLRVIQGKVNLIRLGKELFPYFSGH